MEIHAHSRGAVKQGRVHDVSIFNCQQFLDVEGMGQTVLAYGNGEADEARKVVNEIMRMIWNHRDDLVEKYPNLDDELRKVRESERSIIIGDQGDRVAAGGPGDSTYILNHLLANCIEVETYIPIFDPDAVETCCRAGAGNRIALSFGGKYSTVSPSVVVEGKVSGVGENAPVVYGGPSDGGTKTYIAKYAVFEIGSIKVLLTNQPYAYIDPDYFRAVGLDPEHAKIIVTRSGHHFRLNFAKIGRVVTADTPGMTSYNIDQFAWRHARPFYPLDRIEFEPRQYVRLRR
ncbi:MlrC C-terminal domain-containing protein [Sinorhizobium medicae]|uniref:MlrC C-terminal domain-containing protein n=1 Tax=Sinorhizobium medicae TaxID=110321 RepID=UPI00192E13B6